MPAGEKEAPVLGKVGAGFAHLLLALLSPFLLILCAAALALTDLCCLLFGKRVDSAEPTPVGGGVSVVIPNWNGRDLLAKYVPFVLEAVRFHSAHEVIVVDNGSTDGSVDFLRQFQPAVRVLALKENAGFGAGSNAGFRAAKHDVVVLLNNDMRVEPDFLEPLIEPFKDPLVFAVSCQIYLAAESRRREETGLTEIHWEEGRIRASHRIDPEVTEAFPCAYAGGGSSAFDRRKFLELGGFDEIFQPFYYEDTDLGFAAWRRGWKVLYQPQSRVYHEHRGTIGKTFSPASIQTVVDKNLLLYCWKNIHGWGMLLPHFWRVLQSSWGTMLCGYRPGEHALAGLGRAFLQLPAACKARWRARSLGTLSDREVLRRPLGAYYRDRFELPAEPAPSKPRVLMLAPYAIEPPVHGGAVFMRETLRHLTAAADVHLLCFLDDEKEREANEVLQEVCASAQFLVRRSRLARHPATLLPHAIREFADSEFAWAMHRTIFRKKVDVLQLEYTILAQYAGEYNHLPCVLFEHDVFFQSLGRRLRAGEFSIIGVLEYLRMIRYELRQLRRMARVQVCSAENARYLCSFEPALEKRLDADLRAGVDVASYRPAAPERRLPNTLLFVGNFRHTPNREALSWFIQEVLPIAISRAKDLTFVVAGRDSEKALETFPAHPKVRSAGPVPDVRRPLSECAVFVCPIRSGSGMRVKLLEAFAAGIPVVSTRLGAEGLASHSGEICELADEPEEFARSILRLVENPDYAAELSARAFEHVLSKHEIGTATERLVRSYRSELARCRLAS